VEHLIAEPNWRAGGFRGPEGTFAALADAAQILPGVDAGGVAVEPVELYGVAADGVYAGGFTGGVVHGQENGGLGLAWPALRPSALRSSTQVAHGQAKRSHAKLQALLWPSIQSISMPLPS